MGVRIEGQCHSCKRTDSDLLSVFGGYYCRECNDAIMGMEGTKPWDEILLDLDFPEPMGDYRPASEDVVVLLNRLLPVFKGLLPDPSVWGHDGDKGYTIEQHEGGMVKLLRISDRNGYADARYSVFEGGDRVGNAVVYTVTEG